MAGRVELVGLLPERHFIVRLELALGGDHFLDREHAVVDRVAHVPGVPDIGVVAAIAEEIVVARAAGDLVIPLVASQAQSLPAVPIRFSMLSNTSPVAKL